jgi:hypothetical protein
MLYVPVLTTVYHPQSNGMLERVHRQIKNALKMLYVHVLTTAYHPQSNGMVEHVHHQIKNALGACAYYCLPPSKIGMVERVHRQIKDALRAPGAGLAWQLSSTLGALGATCDIQEGFSCVVSIPGQLLHVPDPHMPPPPTWLSTYAVAADSPPAHLARAEHVYMRVGWPIPGSGQRDKDFHHFWWANGRRSSLWTA